MYRRIPAYLCLLALLLGTLDITPILAQSTSPLPACQPWAGAPEILPSPITAQDNTLFARHGYPIGYGLVDRGLKSTNRGLTWQQFNNPGWGNVVFSTSYNTDRTVVVLTTKEGYISNDAGVNWRTVPFPVTTDYLFALGDAQHLFLSYGRLFPPDMVVPPELLTSSDGGLTWQHIPMGLEVREIAVSPAFAQDHTLLIALGAYKYNGGLLKSTDAGRTWTPADTGITLEGLGIKYLRFSPAYASDHTIYCFNHTGTIENKIYQSTDAGATWRFLADPELLAPPSSPGLLLSPQFPQDQTMWLAFGFWTKVSRDGGRTWQRAPFYDEVRLQAVAKYCRSSGECGVELFGRTLQENETWAEYRSYDYGQTWQCLEDPTTPWPSTPTPPSTSTPTPLPTATPPPVEIPEPATGLLLAAGVAALAGVARWGRQRR